MRRLRFYRTHGGYYALRIGSRWLYWHEGGVRFSEYGNVVGKKWKPKDGRSR